VYSSQCGRAFTDGNSATKYGSTSNVTREATAALMFRFASVYVTGT
jgi:hypothetical protein